MFVEIDDFKHYNDIYGIIEGDGVLRSVGNIIRLTVSKNTNVTGRYVNASFVISLLGVNKPDLQHIARSITESVAGLGIEHKDSGCDGIVTSSIGGTHTHAEQHKSEMSVLKLAAKSLLKAKKKGCNTTIIE